jgi:hypothetical protein
MGKRKVAYVQAIKIYGGSNVYLHSFLIPALDLGWVGSFTSRTIYSAIRTTVPIE